VIDGMAFAPQMGQQAFGKIGGIFDKQQAHGAAIAGRAAPVEDFCIFFRVPRRL